MHHVDGMPLRNQPICMNFAKWRSCLCKVYSFLYCIISPFWPPKCPFHVYMEYLDRI